MSIFSILPVTLPAVDPGETLRSLVCALLDSSGLTSGGGM
jgi:hypothetical protein